MVELVSIRLERTNQDHVGSSVCLEVKVYDTTVHIEFNSDSAEAAIDVTEFSNIDKWLLLREIHNLNAYMWGVFRHGARVVHVTYATAAYYQKTRVHVRKDGEREVIYQEDHALGEFLLKRVKDVTV